MSARRQLLLDLSNNNTVRNLQHARAAGVVGCWLKVSEGDTYVDESYRTLRRLVIEGQLRVGGYHFARPSAGSAARQADRFAALCTPIARRDLRPVLDLEVNDHGLSHAELGAWAHTFLTTFRARTGVCCIVYSYGDFLAQLRLPRPLGCGLWLAAYGRNDGAEHPYHVPAPWRKTVAHQFTSRGRMPGIDGDVDVSSTRSLRPLLARGLRGL